MRSGVIARTIILDKIVSEFLEKHSDTVVVNLACGLDTRCYRNEGRFKGWYNVDLPEAIAVRRKFLTEEGPVFQIAKSAMDESWARDIAQTDGPVLLIIEGLTMYLTEADVKKIFQIIRDWFSQAVIFVEVMSPFVAKHIKEKSIDGSHAKFTWGIQRGRQMERLLPGFADVGEISLIEGMKVFSPIYHVLGRIGFIRNLSNKILVLETR